MLNAFFHRSPLVLYRASCDAHKPLLTQHAAPYAACVAQAKVQSVGICHHITSNVMLGPNYNPRQVQSSDLYFLALTILNTPIQAKIYPTCLAGVRSKAWKKPINILQTPLKVSVTLSPRKWGHHTTKPPQPVIPALS